MKARFFKNLLANTIGINRILFYRTFIERKWRTYQPMLNIISVQEGRESLFEEFLTKSLKLSEKHETPISFGAYKIPDEPLYIYITHYASTWSYVKVMTGILLTGLAIKRARCTTFNNWTYCRPDMQISPQKEAILLVGVRGNPSRFIAYLNKHTVRFTKRIQRIKPIRDPSLANYFVLDNTEANAQLMQDFRLKEGESIKSYDARLLSIAEKAPKIS